MAQFEAMSFALGVTAGVIFTVLGVVLFVLWAERASRELDDWDRDE